ncbi:hypothetical protein, partial [Bradyrhizobium sp. LeoA1S1]
QNADSITASAGAGCSRSSEFGAHDRAKSLLTISEICIRTSDRLAGLDTSLKGSPGIRTGSHSGEQIERLFAGLF